MCLFTHPLYHTNINASTSQICLFDRSSIANLFKKISQTIRIAVKEACRIYTYNQIRINIRINYYKICCSLCFLGNIVSMFAAL